MSFAEQIENNYDNLNSFYTMIDNLSTKPKGYSEKIYLKTIIDEICGLSCFSYISIYQKSMSLNIEADFTLEGRDITLFNQQIRSYDWVNITDIIMGLVHANKIIKGLKFNKVSGRFVDRFNKSDCTFASYFKTNKNIKLCIENCCVCLEPTKTKTLCVHTICIPCWTKIDKKTCPICRQNTNNEYYSDEEEEEE